MFWLPLTGAMPQPVLFPLGKGIVLAPLPAIVPLAAPEAPLPPDAPDVLPLIVTAPAEAPDVLPEVTAPEEPTPLAAPEAVSPVLELPVLAPDVVPLPGVPLIPVVLDVPETEVPLPETTAPIEPVPGLPQAQSPMARRVRYPNERIFRDLSDNFSTPRAWGGANRTSATADCQGERIFDVVEVVRPDWTRAARTANEARRKLPMGATLSCSQSASS
jgi:hypothetical protein